jgi:6-pyruvoyltetrahydropterin/6-carboxytetrahydropterin synthase
MSYEISQRFYFEAAHTLKRQHDTAGSARIHGHTYHAEVNIRGEPNPATGMLVDLGELRSQIEQVRQRLDHSFLDDLTELGPPTLENLCAYVAKALIKTQPLLCSVRIWREATGDSCRYLVY